MIADVGAEKPGALRGEEGVDVFAEHDQVVAGEFVEGVGENGMVGFLVLVVAGIDAEIAFVRKPVDGLHVHVRLLAEELGEELAVPIRRALDEEDAGLGFEDADVERRAGC